MSASTDQTHPLIRTAKAVLTAVAGGVIVGALIYGIGFAANAVVEHADLIGR